LESKTPNSPLASGKQPIPRLYAILDASSLGQAEGREERLAGFVAELLEGGARWVQYRNKVGGAREILRDAQRVRRLAADDVTVILNDRADLCLAAGCDGVHLGQDDLSPAGARQVLGNRLWVGVSTHSVEQVRDADRSSADYIAIGPVFATASKQTPDPVVGLAGVTAARAATRKPLVAIGGINRTNCASVIEAGADSVAVLADLIDHPRKSVADFLRLLR